MVKSTDMKFSDFDPWSNPKASSRGSDKKSEAKGDEPKKPVAPAGKEQGKGNDQRDDRTASDRDKSRQDKPDLKRVIFDTIDAFLGAGKAAKKAGGGGGGKGPRRLFSVSGIISVLVFAWAAMGLYLVDEQERGVVLRFGKYEKVLTPGLNWQPYLIDRVIVLNVTQVRSFSSRGIMLTQDENIVDITINVQYIIDNPENFVIRTRDPEMSLRQATDSSLRHVVGSSAMDRVITEGRAAVAVETQDRIQAHLDDYNTGIRVSQVSIQRADPPEEVKAAFEDVISAREDKVRFINQATAYSNAIVPRARGEARRIMEEGEGYKQDKIARADGEAQRFNLLYSEFQAAPEITRRRLYIEAMEEVLANSNKILIDVSEGNNNLLYLPLDRLISQPGTTERDRDIPAGGASSPAPGLSQQNTDNIVRRVLEEINRQLPARRR